MDVLQTISSAVQIVSSISAAVCSLEQASKSLDDAPNKILAVEEFLSHLKILTDSIKQKHANRLHDHHLNFQIQSLTELIERLHSSIKKAKKILSRSKGKNMARVVWFAVVGDPFTKLIRSVRDDLTGWLELQQMSENLQEVISSTAKNAPILNKVNLDHGYPLFNKCHQVKSLLEKDGSHRVILIVGLSGIGKSCLARQVASNPPCSFVDGAVELGLGKWCSRMACGGSKFEYSKRLAKKILRFLVQIDFLQKAEDTTTTDLEDVCCMLRKALMGKNLLILLDDVWEQDIIERFAGLHDNHCRYLVTTRNESVYEITEAEKVEICKDDVREISKDILLYHSMLSNDELPSLAECLLESCGYHPLTVAVMGKALRNETKLEKWENAISNISTYATSAPGPVSYVNEKDSENTLTVFGSFEFSLEAMPEDAKRFFIALAAVSWAEPIPEAFLEAIWSALGQENLFPLVVCKLVEGSLLIKNSSTLMYHVHDMVSLYLDGKISDAKQILLTDSSVKSTAFISPWLYIFGKEAIKIDTEEKIKSFLNSSCGRHTVITLEAIVKSLMASKSISELEVSKRNFSGILGPMIEKLISDESVDIIVASARAITNAFTNEEYSLYVPSIEKSCAINKLLGVITTNRNPSTLTIISVMLANLANYGSSEIINKILPCMPINDLTELLAPDLEEWHEYVFMVLLQLIKSGKSMAAESLIASGVHSKLVRLLQEGSEVSQHHAIVLLKAIYESGGSFEPGCIRPGVLSCLPWHARLGLEKVILSEKNMRLSPKLQCFQDSINKILCGNNKQVVGAMQDLIPLLEKSDNPLIQDMILESPLIERMAMLLQHGHTENGLGSGSAFILMKLAFFGGEPFVKRFMEYDIVLKLVKMMQENVAELQDAAHAALHQMVFGSGGSLVVTQIVQSWIVGKLARSLDSKFLKTREVCKLFLVDLVEVGNKAIIEQIFTSQTVEKFVSLEITGGIFKGAVVDFLKSLNKCKNLSPAERRVMRQQVSRKVRTEIKGHKLEASLIADLEACLAEGSHGASSNRRKK